MKVTVEVDCTPLEARQFFGLPDVAPMQAAVMAEVEKKMLAEIERFSPETMFRSWLSLFPQNPEQAQEMFTNLFRQGMGAKASPDR